MFALSRDGEKFFLHQPDAGMVVPLVLDFKSKQLAVRVPSIDELENEYAVYDELSEVLNVVSRGHRDQVNFAGRFSQECSKTFRDQLATGQLTISELRLLVQDYLRRAAKTPSDANDSEINAIAGASEAD